MRGSLISPFSGYFAAAVYGLLVYPRLLLLKFVDLGSRNVKQSSTFELFNILMIIFSLDVRTLINGIFQILHCQLILLKDPP